MPTSEVKLNLIKESDFLIEESENEIYITGTKFVMPRFEQSTWTTKNLYIKAYDLTLIEDIILPEKKVVINTRYLRLNKSLQVSVSGKDGDPYPVAANNGRHAGAHGANGKKGNPGSKAGDIKLIAQEIMGEKLTLLANGGNGGKGQDGGNGAIGVTGRDGKDRSRSRRDEGRGIRGGQGGQGGTAGKGGDGGNGGHGGKIEVYLENTENVITQAEPGMGGVSGKNGKPGPGGPGGRGGRGVYCEHERPERN